MVRMVSSGTEATMAAIRLARGVTGRTKLIKFEGCYHGHADSLLVKAGSGVATLGLPDSPGVPAALAQNTLTVPFNNAKALAEVFAEHAATSLRDNRTGRRQHGMCRHVMGISTGPQTDARSRRAADFR